MEVVFGLAGRGPISRSLLVATSLGLLLLIILFLTQTGSLQSLAYQLAREMAKASLLGQVAEWETIMSEHFVVKFLPQDRDVAPLVLKAAEAAYGPVTRELGYAPPGRTVVVIYPTREDLNASFGWPGQESTMGVYWGGAIRVLSPKAWIEGENLKEMAQVFRTMGPMVHEFAHLVLDYKTKGNYPRWFSEGLAQYLEVRQGGVLWNEGAQTLKRRHYSLVELERFDELDQNLAYSDALSLVEYLVETRGEAGLKKIIEALAKGASFSKALAAAGFTSPAELEAGWKVSGLQ